MSQAKFDTEIPKLPKRKKNSHKGDYGHALLIGGSQAMAGSITLSAMATLRSGAGLVSVAVPKSIQANVAQFDPSYMTIPLVADRAGKIPLHQYQTIHALTKQKTCLGIGPGLGRSTGLNLLVQRLYQELTLPMVIDADALNALSDHANPLACAAGPRIMTPHPGEFRRLLRQDLSVSAMRKEAINLAQKHQVIIVLKGNKTLVTNGKQSYLNQTGNPGMATGGSGDVLTGIISGLVSQGMQEYEAAKLGVYLHGLAGDIAAKQIGQASLIATDILDFLEDAFKFSN